VDSKTQISIYALDALAASIRSNLRLVEALKAVTEQDPDPKPVVNLKESEKQGFVRREFDPFPPCMPCALSDCSICKDRLECNEYDCDDCNFKYMC